jgi:hypothetical protein
MPWKERTAMGLDDIIKGVADALTGDDKKQPGARDQGGLLGAVTDLLTGSGQNRQPDGQNIRPASEDPLGDPADTVDGRTVLPASQDPLGDPADQLAGQNIRPASEDPLGDPADEERR